ncbi:MAG: FKBP-type peptidyl-prolyl cis-trans isomerase [Phaeodactylibacter sp.]|nr:FKBP-type peptidyl-prolyl cis-trans isomerase [Phaeodactylibacter sp.]MCB9264045.1 FKBP-type peptidyl-prolyl cis-trans isomerase [Lewinellaceae bacterium]MCB9289879.1 FKBP-type peptidyl-prolyl cis-trans isomerase [Lewinellaceae bacterium]
MKKTILLLSFFAALLAACGGHAGEKGSRREATEKQAEEATPPVDEDQAVLQLSSYLIAEPQNQAETDQNAIVNYAIDELIPLERTSSGLLYRILDEGAGKKLQWGDYISVHYKGYFLNGQVFDSSYRRDKPLQFYIGNMVPGWNEGLQLIAPGGRIQLFVPSPLGYGAEGLPDGKEGFLVPPDTPMVFEVEVLEKLKSAGEE